MNGTAPIMIFKCATGMENIYGQRILNQGT
jgi:hypothetical protein